ncbi:MAG: transporter substrate-binding domain-containing protein [Hyphomicrobiaceae bacterium]
MEMNEQVKAELTPTGKLRAAINMSNFLLVTGKADNGDPTGVSPEMAAEVARRLGVPLELIPYPNPGALGDDADSGNWDIGNIGAEPQRAEKIAFSAAYCEIEATYLVPAGSSIKTIADVDKPGVRISVTGRAAYGLWLQNNIKQAELVKTDSLDSAYETFVSDKLEVLAGLRPRLISDVEKLPGARILDGQFSAVQQAVGTPKKNSEAAKWLAAFVEEAKASGMVAGFIAKHNVVGLSVAPAA